MKKTYKISAEQAKKMREKIKEIKNKNVCNRLEALALLGEGKTPKEVSEIKKYHEKYIRTLGLKYHEKGLDEFLIDGRKGGNRRNLSVEEEKSFLKQFEETAEKGQILTVEEIAKQYDELVKKEHKSKSTVYYLLHKFKWRKLMPRSKHPNKASDEVVKASKKLTLNSKK